MMVPCIKVVVQMIQQPIESFPKYPVIKTIIPISGRLSQDLTGSGQNRVTAKSQVGAGPSHSAARNITVAKFNN